jgi:hypothetical protein
VDAEGVLQIRIVDHLSYDVYVKILFHALTEALLCLHRGISEKSVTDFDLDFEKKRDAGIYDASQEPGEHVLAPYRHEHAFAMVIESLVYAEWIRVR